MTRRPGARGRPDHFTRKAKAQSFPARSVFKLEEIDRKHHLLAPRQSVLDLGCAPGSWLKYAAGRVGPEGLVVGVDNHGLDIPLPKNARYLRADALAIGREELAPLASGLFDVVLSDMAPHTSGNRFVDQQRSLRLFLRALEIAAELCRPGGAFLGKLFHGEDVDEAVGRAGELFGTVKLVKPAAVRKGSYEVYVLGVGRKAAPRVDGDGPR